MRSDFGTTKFVNLHTMKKFSYVLIALTIILLVGLPFLWYETHQTALCIVLMVSLSCLLIADVLALRRSRNHSM